MNPRFFQTPAEFRAWLEQYHAQAQELSVGFYKKHTGKPSLTYQEALDAALCFGWIDGVRQSLDENRYTIRFTPRRPKSNWSSVNIKRVGELSALGQMRPPGLTAFESRDQARSEQREHERRTRQLDKEHVKQFQANKKAWEFFQAQAPSYQRVATWWVMSAKQEETRLRRLATLIRDSEEGRRVASVAIGARKPETKPGQSK